jgi:hypothetical protein
MNCESGLYMYQFHVLINLIFRTVMRNSLSEREKYKTPNGEICGAGKPELNFPFFHFLTMKLLGNILFLKCGGIFTTNRMILDLEWLARAILFKKSR